MIIPVSEFPIYLMDIGFSCLIGFKGEGFPTEPVSLHLGVVKLLHLSNERIQFYPHIGLDSTASGEEVNQPNDVAFRRLLWRDVPETEGSIITAASERRSVAGKSERVYPTAMSLEFGELRTAVYIPKINHLMTGTRQRLSTVRKRNILHRSDTCAQCATEFPSGNIPQLDFALIPSTREELTVR